MPTIIETLARMDGLLARWDGERDRRAVFALSYRVVTGRMAEAIAAGDFEDNPWMETLDVTFAEEYFQALDAYESGRGRLPGCWRLAFEWAADGRTTVVQDLLLGMNAHIVHDLPIALSKLGLPAADRERRRRDHDRVNDVLDGLIDRIQEEVRRRHSFLLGILDRVNGGADELLTGAGIRAARTLSWTTAVALAEAPDEAARAALLAELDGRASAAARALVPQPAGSGSLVSRVRAWDRALAALWRRLAPPVA